MGVKYASGSEVIGSRQEGWGSVSGNMQRIEFGQFCGTRSAKKVDNFFLESVYEINLVEEKDDTVPCGRN